MKAATVRRVGAPLELSTLQRPVPGPTEVLVRTIACGICRTDLHVREGTAYQPSLPHVPGHEPAGVIEALGSGVTGWKVGERVVPHLFEYADDGHLEVLGVTRDGAFAEYFVARAENLVRIPSNVSPIHAGLAACAGVTAVHAINRGDISKGDRVAIIGAGGIGALLIQLSRDIGAHVTAIDLNREALMAAHNEGAAETATPESAKETKAKSFDRVFDLVGSSDTSQLACDLVRDRGRIIIIGESDEFLRTTSTVIAQRELEIIGSRNGSKEELAEALRLMSEGSLLPRIDRTISLAESDPALDEMASGNTNGRIVIVF